MPYSLPPTKTAPDGQALKKSLARQAERDARIKAQIVEEKKRDKHARLCLGALVVAASTSVVIAAWTLLLR